MNRRREKAHTTIYKESGVMEVKTGLRACLRGCDSHNKVMHARDLGLSFSHK